MQLDSQKSKYCSAWPSFAGHSSSILSFHFFSMLCICNSALGPWDIYFFFNHSFTVYVDINHRWVSRAVWLKHVLKLKATSFLVLCCSWLIHLYLQEFTGYITSIWSNLLLHLFRVCLLCNLSDGVTMLLAMSGWLQPRWMLTNSLLVSH